MLWLLIYLPFVFSAADGAEGGVKCKTEKLKGKWKGEFYQFSYGYDERYPMRMHVEKVKGCTFTGKFHWFLNGHQVSNLEGEIKRDTVFVRELSQLSGNDNLVLKGTYVIPWRDDLNLEGKWLTPDNGRVGGTFKISKGSNK